MPPKLRMIGENQKPKMTPTTTGKLCKERINLTPILSADIHLLRVTSKGRQKWIPQTIRFDGRYLTFLGRERIQYTGATDCCIQVPVYLPEPNSEHAVPVQWTSIMSTPKDSSSSLTGTPSPARYYQLPSMSTIDVSNVADISVLKRIRPATVSLFSSSSTDEVNYSNGDHQQSTSHSSHIPNILNIELANWDGLVIKDKRLAKITRMGHLNIRFQDSLTFEHWLFALSNAWLRWTVGDPVMANRLATHLKQLNGRNLELDAGNDHISNDDDLEDAGDILMDRLEPLKQEAWNEDDEMRTNLMPSTSNTLLSTDSGASLKLLSKDAERTVTITRVPSRIIQESHKGEKGHIIVSDDELNGLYNQMLSW